MPTRDGTMLTMRAGSCSLWCSLCILVAAAVAPLGRWNTAVEIVFVGIDGAEGVSILFSDSGHQGDTPKWSPRAYVPSEDSRH